MMSQPASALSWMRWVSSGTSPRFGGMDGAASTFDRVRLVITADDFGISPGVNAGIEEAIAAETVSSVSVLVNAPGFDDAVVRLRRIGDRVCVGLHLNLTLGRPLTACRSLVDARTGHLLPLRTV